MVDLHIHDRPREADIGGYNCPSCKRKKAVVISKFLISCMICGWNISTGDWNAMTPEQQKNIPRRK